MIQTEKGKKFTKWEVLCIKLIKKRKILKISSIPYLEGDFEDLMDKQESAM